MNIRYSYITYLNTILRLLPQNSTEDEKIGWILRGFMACKTMLAKTGIRISLITWIKLLLENLKYLTVPRYLIEQLNEIVKYSKGSDHTGGPNQSAGFANVKNANTTDRSASLGRFPALQKLVSRLERFEDEQIRRDWTVKQNENGTTRAQLGKPTRTYHPELFDDLTLAEAIKAVKRQQDLSGQVNSEPKQSVRSTVKLCLKAYEAHAGELPARNKVLERSQAQQELFEFMDGPPLVTPQQPRYRHEANQVYQAPQDQTTVYEQTMQQAARAQQQRHQQQQCEQGHNREQARPSNQMTSLLKQISPHVLKDIRVRPFLRENMRQLPQPNKVDALQQSDPLQGAGPGFGFLNTTPASYSRELIIDDFNFDPHFDSESKDVDGYRFDASTFLDDEEKTSEYER
ncbi:uncharacterized protein RAG0_15387 [Rhynchosporium agropyri]|uniref:Uncharacterized protein n=1 Tax=Rhynchosporium agropyri TaxID=914238 RepID=A0A1E1LKW5_9HELO|nr:uncharacterized protein RAG0_15387 [Rhynchosporium agropyri]